MKIKIIKAKKKFKPTKDLGYANSWAERPKEVKKCEKLGHRKTDTKTSMRCVTRIECLECGYFYLIDSSD